MTNQVHESSGLPDPPRRRVRFVEGRGPEGVDLAEEQAYHTGRRWFHGRALHGWGTVVGLRVRPDAEGTGARVVVEPGLALDPAGREIVVAAEQTLDVEAAAGARAGPGRPLHVAIRYLEREIEGRRGAAEGSGGAPRPEPDRVGEGYALGVLADEDLPRAPEPDPASIRLRWRHTMGVARPIQIVPAPRRGRLYVLAGGDQGVLYAYHAGTHAARASLPVGNGPTALALSPDGRRAWIATARANASTPYRVLEVDLEEMERNRDRAVVAEYPVAGAAAGEKGPVLASPDGRWLFAVRRGDPDGGGQVLAWDLAGERSAAGVPPGTACRVGLLPWGMALAPDGGRLYVACSGEDRVEVLDVARLTGPTPLAPETHVAQVRTEAEPDRVALASGGRRLLVTCRGGRSLQVTDVRDLEARAAAAGAATVAFPQTPVDLRVSATGQWAFVLTGDATGDEGRGSLRVINIEAAATAGGEAVGGFSVEVGDNPQGLALDATGRVLYVANPASAAAGGGAIAIVEIEEGTPIDALRRSVIAPAPAPASDWVVLATVTGFVPGRRITAGMVDNWTARRLVPPLDSVVEAIRRLAERGGEPAAAAGGEGAPADGAGAETGSAQATAGAPPAAPGPRPEGGPAAAPGEGTRITRINWPHGGTVARADLPKGLEVGFNHEVLAACLREETFQLQVRRSNPKTGDQLYWTVPAPPVRIRVAADGRAATLYLADSPYLRDALKAGDRMRVVLLGDLVLDRNHRAIEAAVRFLPEPDGSFVLERGGSGGEGGQFVSWFTLR